MLENMNNSTMIIRICQKMNFGVFIVFFVRIEVINMTSCLWGTNSNASKGSNTQEEIKQGALSEDEK